MKEKIKYILVITGLTALMTVPAAAQSEADGAKLYVSSRGTETGAYTEVGVKFSKWSDATAMFRPSRWNSPLKTGGALSWFSPTAWREAPGRTAIVFLGEAVVIGGIVIGVSASSGGGGGSSGGGGSPAGPSGGGGGTPPGTPGGPVPGTP